MARSVDAARPWTISRGHAWLLAAPLVFLAIFFLWPLARVVVRGFVDPALGLGNYARIFGDGPYLRVIWNTIETAAAVTAICLVVAYPVAYVMARARGAWLQIMAALIVIPLWTSVVIRSYAWMVVFQRRGVLNDLLLGLGLVDTPVRFLPGSIGVHVGMVHIMLPFMILPLVANMRGIDQTLLRAAEILGANPFNAFLRVFLPLSLPGINAGVALVFMTSLGFFITPALLGGPQHMMAAVLIEQQANVYLNWGLASALASTLLVVTLAIYLFYLRVTGGAAGTAIGR
ncbi:MAG: ABC transporter permease [Alphaproteobacteria bacterium]|nr:ABC transporter permease [Alphaproteobacteria bacterium]